MIYHRFLDSLNKKIYAFGGISSSKNYDDIEVYDMEKDIWK